MLMHVNDKEWLKNQGDQPVNKAERTDGVQDFIVINELPRFAKDVKSFHELNPTDYNGGIKRKESGNYKQFRVTLEPRNFNREGKIKEQEARMDRIKKRRPQTAQVSKKKEGEGSQSEIRVDEVEEELKEEEKLEESKVEEEKVQEKSATKPKREVKYDVSAKKLIFNQENRDTSNHTLRDKWKKQLVLNRNNSQNITPTPTKVTNYNKQPTKRQNSNANLPTTSSTNYSNVKSRLFDSISKASTAAAAPEPAPVKPKRTYTQQEMEERIAELAKPREVHEPQPFVKKLPIKQGPLPMIIYKSTAAVKAKQTEKKIEKPQQIRVKKKRPLSSRIILKRDHSTIVKTNDNGDLD